MLNVTHPCVRGEVGQLVAKTPRPQLRSLPRLAAGLRARSSPLPKPFQDAAFAFRSKYLTGAKEDRPRWKKCVAATDRALGRGARACPSSRRPSARTARRVTKSMVEADRAGLRARTWTR